MAMTTRVLACVLLCALLLARGARATPREAAHRAGAASAAMSRADADRITSLPGWEGPLPSAQYSGYINVTDTKMFHYWFVESEGSVANDPVILWLNGGPGCSSLDGLISEHGPFTVEADGTTLKKRPTAWTALASIIYLESPVGVGFSYSDKESDYTTNDVITARDNHEFLRQFFAAFPQFASHEFYIAGESYGGIYVPTLAAAVVHEPAGIAPLRGILVGNGVHDHCLNSNAHVYFNAYHTLIGADAWDNLKLACNSNFCDNKHPDCVTALQRMKEEIGPINIYNTYGGCYAQPDPSFHPVRYDGFVGTEVIGAAIPCVNTTAERTWLNTPAVQHALHVKPIAWSVCNEDTLHYANSFKSMYPFYRQLLDTGKLRILLYHGDVDNSCPALQGEWFVQGLALETLNDRRPFFFANQQIAGYVTEFSQDVHLATTLGCGHMSPQWCPHKTFAMFERWLHHQPL